MHLNFIFCNIIGLVVPTWKPLITRQMCHSIDLQSCQDEDTIIRVEVPSDCHRRKLWVTLVGALLVTLIRVSCLFLIQKIQAKVASDCCGRLLWPFDFSWSKEFGSKWHSIIVGGDMGWSWRAWWELLIQIVKRIKEAYDYRGRKHRVGALDQTIPGQRGIWLLWEAFVTLMGDLVFSWSK